MLRERLRGVKNGIKRRIQSRLDGLSAAPQDVDAQRDDSEEGDALAQTANNGSALETSRDDPPVVARLMVEIRSDGTRTVARGALKDELSGEQVSLVAQGSTPLSLAAQLAKNLLTTPLAAAQFARAMKRQSIAEKKSEPPPPDEP